MRIHRFFPHAVPALLLAAILGGCEGFSPFGSDDDADRVDFGDPYEIMASPASDGPLPAPPRIDGDSLRLSVRYGGGGAPHDFILHTRRDGTAATLWIWHDANGDTCEALLTRPVARRLPAQILAADSIRLLAPRDTVFVLQ